MENHYSSFQISFTMSNYLRFCTYFQMLFWKIKNLILRWIQNILTNGGEKKKPNKPKTQISHCEKCFVFKIINYLHHRSGFLPKQSPIWNSIIQYEIIWENRSRKKHKQVFILTNRYKYLQLLPPLIQIMITTECSYMTGSWDLPVEFALLTWNFSTQIATLVWR